MPSSLSRITYANDLFCQISRYRREELIGQDHRILNSGHHPKAFFQNLWKTIARGNAWQGQIKNRAKDGSIYWTDSSIVPIKNTQGKITGYAAIRTDITPSKLAEEKLNETYNELERFNQLMTGRELRVIEMKEEVNTLLAQLNQAPKYRSVLEKTERELTDAKPKNG